MLPAGKLCGAKVAFRPGPAEKIPRQFGPISRAPCARTRASSWSWRRMPSMPVSAKPGGDHAEGARALRHRRLGLGEHRVAGDAEHGQVDDVGDVGDRRVGLHAGDRRGLRVHRVGDASKFESRMLRKSSPPIEPRREEAPTTATVRGEKKGASEAATATWSRSSTASR